MDRSEPAEHKAFLQHSAEDAKLRSFILRVHCSVDALRIKRQMPAVSFDEVLLDGGAG
jgi:hypothetical protein